MKKGKVLTFMFILIKVVMLAQAAFNMPLEDRWVKPLIKKSSTIIEGVVIDIKTIKHATSDSGGDSYIFYFIKPRMVFKGLIDSTKIFEVCLGKDPYSTKPEGIYAVDFSEHSPPPAKSGIFFFTNKSKMPDFIKPLDNAICLNWYYAIDYVYYDRESTLKLLKEKFNLKPLALFKSTILGKEINDDIERRR